MESDEDMAVRAITINVDEEAARAFIAAPDEARRKMELLLSLRLKDVAVGPQRSLKAIMDEIGAQAEAQGITPEILESLLDGE